MLNAIDPLVRKPSVERYLSARFQLLRSVPADQRDRSVLADWEICFERADWRELTERIELVYAAWQLSPRAHFFLGVAASELGDVPTAEQCRRKMQALLKVILQTGEGTPDSPWTVTYSSDPRDVARALDFHPVRHHLIETPVCAPPDEDPVEGALALPVVMTDHPIRRLCDVLTDPDGHELWFDVTEVLLTQGPAVNQHEAVIRHEAGCEVPRSYTPTTTTRSLRSPHVSTRRRTRRNTAAGEESAMPSENIGPN